MNTASDCTELLELSPPASTGSPRKSYTPVVVTKLLESVAKGLSLKDACELYENEPGFPNYHSVFNWLYKYPEFEELYTKARLQHYEVWAKEMIDIADAAHDRDWKARKLRIETRQWILERAHPDRWALKLKADVKHSVEIQPIININIKLKAGKKGNENLQTNEVGQGQVVIDVSDAQAIDCHPVKRKPGRPKGSKNRPKNF